MTYLAVIYWIIGTLLPSQNLDTSIKNLDKYYEAVARIESDMTHDARNPNTTAKSYFQFTDGAFKTAKLRAKRMGHDIQVRYVMSLDYEQQRDLAFLDLYQRKGTNKYIRGILRGDKRLAMEAYYKFHHTNPDQATRKRAERIFGKYYA